MISLMKRIFCVAVMLTALVACTTTKFQLNQIDTRISATSQESRVRFLILHYTAIDQAASLEELSRQNVSSHYLVSDDNPTTVFRLVDETQMAHHAGISHWKSYTQLNANSIGIEIVNLGYQETPDGRRYLPYPQQQIDALIILMKDIVARHKIKPEFILGHAEIAPQRKPDPGPLFPWKQLAEAGLIVLPDMDQVRTQQAVFTQQLPEAIWFQKKLAEIGYATPQTGVLDAETKNVLAVFQTRYRPSQYDGAADAETAALLEVITRKLLP